MIAAEIDSADEGDTTTLPGTLEAAAANLAKRRQGANDAERLSVHPAMRAIVDRRGLAGTAASISQMGRFETAWLTHETNLAALSDLGLRARPATMTRRMIRVDER